MSALFRKHTVLKGMRAIELFRDGYTPAEIVKIMGIKRITIYKYFKAGGGRSPDDFKAHYRARQERSKKVIVVE